ncbi:hypothetical protein [Nocardia ignorata]|uniref:Uncharacterized protein n=1 Tax=Nocardia ignorata TaxID=145285 RepID=A0A4R6NZQ7_NOCIG|nr:hypothetical protein [Nocardia ignorata]TDP29787.1 hypothetical protein DFR75_11255 [Nocardia ignorata]
MTDSFTTKQLENLAATPFQPGRDTIARLAAELLTERARVADLEGWQSRAFQQARRAADDTDRWNALWQAADGKSTELADMIDAVLDQRDDARARVDELEAEIRELRTDCTNYTQVVDELIRDRDAAEREPLGYAALVQANSYTQLIPMDLTRGKAEQSADWHNELTPGIARVVALHEPNEVAE